MNNSEILMLKSAGFTQAQISNHKQKFKNLMRLAPSLLIQECENLRARVAELTRDRDDCLYARTKYAERVGELLGKVAEIEAKVPKESRAEIEARALEDAAQWGVCTPEKLRQLAAEKRAGANASLSGASPFFGEASARSES